MIIQVRSRRLSVKASQRSTPSPIPNGWC